MTELLLVLARSQKYMARCTQLNDDEVGVFVETIFEECKDIEVGFTSNHIETFNSFGDMEKNYVVWLIDLFSEDIESEQKHSKRNKRTKSPKSTSTCKRNQVRKIE